MRFVLESGRRVAVHLSGTRALWPSPESRHERLVVFCHGAPGAGLFDPDPDLTRQHNVTLLSVDRPGYGRSDPVPAGQWATVGAAADDIAAVLETLHVERVGVVGSSAGGRIALALAARHQELVDRVVVAATPAPDDEIPWVDPGERVALEQLRELPPEHAQAELGRRLDPLVPEDPCSGEALALLGAGADEPALRDVEVRTRLGETVQAAFTQGTRGLAADIAGYCLQPWGFEPDAIEAETLLLYGSQDPVAGPAHGRWWERQLADARLEVIHGAGHLVLAPMWARALDHLAPDGNIRVLAGLRDRGDDSGFEHFPAA